ncbi:phage tail tape measure protein [Gammaproteobacteria bacterium AS21]
MSANYKLTLQGENRVSKVLRGAAADSGQLTAALAKQQKVVRDLNNTTKKLGNYAETRKQMQATRVEYGQSKKVLEGYALEAKSAASDLKRLRLEQKDTAAAINKLNTVIKKTGKPNKDQAQQMKMLVKRQSAYNDEIKETEARTKKLKTRTDAASKAGVNLERTYRRQEDRLERLGGELVEAGVDTRRLASEQERLGRQTLSANNALAAQKTRLSNLNHARNRKNLADNRMNDAQGRIAGTLAMAAGVVMPVKRAVTMESAIADVDKVADFKGDEKAKFQSDIQKLAVEVNIPPEQLTLIAASGAQSGNVKKSDLIDFTRSTSKMAVAFDMSAGSAGEAMIAWRDSMNLNKDQALALMDAVNFVGNNTGGKASEISGVLKRQGSLAKKSGLAPEEIAGLAGAILSGKQGEEISATALKNLLSALTMGNKASKSKKEGLKALGFNSKDLPSAMQTDAKGTLLELFKRLRSTEESKQIGLMKQIMGEESVGALAPLLENAQLLDKAFGLVSNPANYKGSAEQEYKKMINTSEHKLGAAWRAIDRLGLVLGSTLLPATNKVAEGVEWAANGLANLAEKSGAATTVFTGGVALLTTFMAGKLAKDLIKGKFGQLRAGSALKVAKAEGKLATNSGLATIAINRLNTALNRTARSRNGVSYGGDFDVDRDRKSNTKNSRKNKLKSRGKLSKILDVGLSVLPMGVMDGDVIKKSAPITKKGVPGKAAEKSVATSKPKVKDIKNSRLSSADEAIETVADATTKLNSSATTTVSNTIETASDAATRVGHGVVKVIRPVALALDVVQLGSAIKSGDVKEIAETSGEIAGGTAGAWGGAAAGAAVGTAIVPVIGTVIGGIIGGILGGWGGSEAGEWAGGKVADGLLGDEKTGSAFKSLEAEIKQKQINKLSQSNKIDLHSVINIQLSPEENAKNINSIVEKALKESINENLVPALNNSLQDSIDDDMLLAP